ncbi:ATP-dependent DNA ligase [Prauserella marina]|uniref:DNA ligase D, polymerase domain-containing protein n=1 Tax=Prauserella marina TaxID=530584 RepID=A0A222VYT6_9PSEU|nr:DNA primase small subunit domain-containing protein [Prauserella marina]ASR39146.1 ATP-dependent DNA ligase [Prauserella marina]PWV84902.1 DNA ligase D-like protein (predicted polymerase) [Prauserella marina]SDC09952.1 DNA ligase D, polymerase domain-containing protein [Prauserella marina]
MSERISLDVDGTEVTVSSPDKVFFPQRGETKLDLVRYYQAVAGPLLETLRGRPLLMERYPAGAGGKSWFQKRVPKSVPDWLTTTVVSTPNGTTSDALVAADLAHILWAVNLGCLGFHVWPYHAATPEVTDELRVDLDPSPGVTFDDVRQTAVLTRELLAEYGIEAHLKTSGSRGLHVYVRLEPRWNSYEVRAGAVALARELERRHSGLITAQWWKEERGSRVFVDFNQNAPHRTVFGAWCVRPRAGAQVSTPVAWTDVDGLDQDALTIATVPALLAERGDPWEGINDRPQSLEPLLEQSRKDLASGLMDAPWPPVYPKQPGEPPRVAPSRAKST